MMDPERLKTSGATKLERQLLLAAGDELPSPELTARMRQAIGITAVGAGAAGGSALAATTKTGGLAWISAGLVTAAIVGGAAGIWSAYRPAAATHEAPAASAQCAAPLPASAEIVAPMPAMTRHERRRAHAPLVAEAGRGDLRAEIALVDEARTAVRERSPRRALALLRRYAVAYPEGTFGPEAEALKVEALDQSGEHRLASSLARTFVSEHPDSPLAERVARSIDDQP